MIMTLVFAYGFAKIYSQTYIKIVENKTLIGLLIQIFIQWPNGILYSILEPLPNVVVSSL